MDTATANGEAPPREYERTGRVFSIRIDDATEQLMRARMLREMADPEEARLLRAQAKRENRQVHSLGAFLVRYALLGSKHLDPKVPAVDPRQLRLAPRAKKARRGKAKKARGRRK